VQVVDWFACDDDLSGTADSLSPPPERGGTRRT
jgi:hypothetical protein